MVGDRGEVERTLELDHLGALAVDVERRQRDGRPFGEVVRLGGRRLHVERLRVERERRVHVQVAEVEIAERIVAGAGGARLLVGTEDRRARRLDVARDRPALDAAPVQLELCLGRAEPGEQPRLAVERDGLPGHEHLRVERGRQAVGRGETRLHAELQVSHDVHLRVVAEQHRAVPADAEATEDVAAAVQLERRRRARALQLDVAVDARR